MPHLFSARPVMRWTMLLFVIGLSVCTGCGEGSNRGGFTKVGAKVTAAQAPMARDQAEQDAVFKGAPAQEGAPGGGAEVKAPNAAVKEQKADQPRKIKYTADLRVIVEEFDAAWSGLKTLIKD